MGRTAPWIACEYRLLSSLPLAGTLRTEPHFVEGDEEALLGSRQAYEIAEGRTSGLVNLVFSRQTGFPSANIRLLMRRGSYLSPLYQAHSDKEGVRTGIPARSRIRSIKILLDLCSVFIEQTKIELVKEKLYYQGPFATVVFAGNSTKNEYPTQFSFKHSDTHIN